MCWSGSRVIIGQASICPTTSWINLSKPKTPIPVSHMETQLQYLENGLIAITCLLLIAGIMNRRQVFFSLFDMYLHTEKHGYPLPYYPNTQRSVFSFHTHSVHSTYCRVYVCMCTEWTQVSYGGSLGRSLRLSVSLKAPILLPASATSWVDMMPSITATSTVRSFRQTCSRSFRYVV